MRKQVHIVGTGSYLPEKRLSNQWLADTLGVTTDWIFNRTGILERRVVSREQATSDLAVNAAEKALLSSGIPAAKIDLIIVATSTPDTLIPSTACRVQQALGASSAGAFDIGAACSGFIYGLATANGYIQCGLASNFLLIAAETRTRFVNYHDLNTAVLYGDGAWAVVVSQTDKLDTGFIQLTIGADGKGKDTISIPAGGSLLPASHETVDKCLHFIHIEGRSVATSAVRCLTKLIEDSFNQAGITIDEIDLIIPHQMNLRLIEAVAKRSKIPIEKFYINIERCGNTSAASVPIALDEALKQGRICSGSLIMLVAFGAGFTWGSVLIRW